ncbi:MAG: protein kinase [Gemmatimonas sp.]|nr:protein kinase [Gemmatimonas sp.]
MSGIEGLLIGRELGGRYRIEELIGRGGMGAVYRAVDERLGRQVALKVITVAGTGDESRERLRARFFREARSAAALPHHPNVVPVYDYGSDEDLGLDYLVMELLHGSDLATRLSSSGAPPLAASLKILVEAARGLAVGHRKGLIHRDVKPGNIFLAETHANEVQVRVVDFGIAKLADEEDTLAQLTQDGRVPHSPAYASPEQLRGLTNLTPASDVFSLGAVGYELLTRERPFTESDRNRMSLGMPVAAPSVRSTNPAVPATAEEVIGKALSYDSEQRFADAGEMGSALEQAIRSIADTTVDPYLAGAPIVTAAGIGDATPIAPGDDRTRIAAAVEEDLTLLAPTGIEPPMGRGGASPPPPRPIATTRRHDRGSRKSIGGVIVWGLVIGVLLAAVLWGLVSRNGGEVAVDEFPPPDSVPLIVPQEQLDAPPDAPGPLDAYINDQEGRRYYRAGAYDSAWVQFNRAVQLEPDNPDYRRNYALALLAVGRPLDADREVRRAIQIAPNRAPPYQTLAQIRLALGDTASAIAAFEDYLDRETRPREAGIADRNLRGLRAAYRVGRFPPLLGDTVSQEQPETPEPSPEPEPGPTPEDTTSPPDTAALEEPSPPIVPAPGDSIADPDTTVPPPDGSPAGSIVPATPLGTPRL